MATSRGTLIVSTSTFSGNIADVHGGAIDNANFDGKGTAVVSASTFSANSANNIYEADGARGGGVMSTGKYSTRLGRGGHLQRPAAGWGVPGRTKVITSGATGAAWAS